MSLYINNVICKHDYICTDIAVNINNPTTNSMKYNFVRIPGILHLENRRILIIDFRVIIAETPVRCFFVKKKLLQVISYNSDTCSSFNIDGNTHFITRQTATFIPLFRCNFPCNLRRRKRRLEAFKNSKTIN